MIRLRYANIARAAIAAAGVGTLIACRDSITPSVPDRPLGPASVILPPVRSGDTVFSQPGPQYGINIVTYELGDNYGSAHADTVASLAAQAGISYVRLPVYWNEQQPTSAALWNASARDTLHRAVAHVVNAGMLPVLVLQGAPNWAESCATGCANYSGLPDSTHLADWRAFVDSLVNDPSLSAVVYWEIGNEVNGNGIQVYGSGTRLSREEDMVSYASTPIHAAAKKLLAPDIIGGIVDNSTGLAANGWLNSFLSSQGSHVDVVTVHEYRGLNGMSTLEDTLSSYVAHAMQGGTWPLWLTEAGLNPLTPISDAVQETQLTDLFNRMNSGRVPRWQKTFFWHMTNYNTNDQSGILKNAYTSFTPTKRPAYTCLQGLAVGPTVAPACWP